MTRDMHLDTKPEWEIKNKYTGQAPLTRAIMALKFINYCLKISK